MMERRKKYIAVLTAVLILSAMLTLSAAGYFIANKAGADINAGFDVDNTAVTVEVATFEDLYRYGKGTGEAPGEKNDPSPVSDSRTVLAFTEDITLTADLEISRDCHLDLRGHTLDLGGYELSFRHTYTGSIRIRGGTRTVGGNTVYGAILPGTRTVGEGAESVSVDGHIYFFTPNAYPYFEGVWADAAGSAAFAEETLVTVKEADPRTVAYHLLRMVNAALSSDTDVLPPLPGYAELASSTAITEAEGLLTFSPTLFRTDRGGACTLCAGADAEGFCAYLWADADLPTQYGSLPDYRVEYTSSNETLLSPHGKATPAAGEIRTVTLTADLYREGARVATAAFPVHIADCTDAGIARTVSQTRVESILAQYLTTDAEGKSVYAFRRGLYMPCRMDYGSVTTSITYSFQKKNEEGDYIDDTTALVTPLPDGTDMADADVCNLEPTESSTRLTAVFSAGGTDTTVTYAITAQDASLIVTATSRAQNFLSRAYGNQVKIVESKDAVTGISSYSEVTLTPLDDEAAADGIATVTYSLRNDENRIYELYLSPNTVESITYQREELGAKVRVRAGADPSLYVLDVQLACHFTFNDGSEDADILIPVLFVASEQGSNVNGFLPYYNHFNTYLFQVTSGSTVEDFSMPLAYGSAPAVVYDVATVTADGDGNPVYTLNGCPALRLRLYYNGAVQEDFGTPAVGQSYTELFDGHLKSRGVTLDEIVGYGDAAWLFTIDKQVLGIHNTEIALIYNYKMSLSANTWTPYMGSDGYIVSNFVLLGVLRYDDTADKSNDQNPIKDENFYAWIYNRFYGTAESERYVPGGTDYQTKIILGDWLQQSIPLDVTATADTDSQVGLLQAVNDFSGIEYLTGTKVVNLTGAITDKDAARVLIGKIARMTALEELYLGECVFYDRESATATEASYLACLADLPQLRVLHLENNRIYNFDFLRDLKTLEEVYVYGNIVDGGDVYDVFYGALGIANYVYFNELVDRGVQVYNRSTVSGTTETPHLFVKITEINDYANLAAIEYQRRLKAGVNIGVLWEDLSTDPADYGAQTSYNAGGADRTVINTGTVNGITLGIFFGYTDAAGNIIIGSGGDYATQSDTLVVIYRFYLTGYPNYQVQLVVKLPVARY